MNEPIVIIKYVSPFIDSLKLLCNKSYNDSFVPLILYHSKFAVIQYLMILA